MLKSVTNYSFIMNLIIRNTVLAITFAFLLTGCGAKDAGKSLLINGQDTKVVEDRAEETTPAQPEVDDSSKVAPDTGEPPPPPPPPEPAADEVGELPEEELAEEYEGEPDPSTEASTVTSDLVEDRTDATEDAEDSEPDETEPDSPGIDPSTGLPILEPEVANPENP